ncbi:MAG: GDSL-type esterase/lipase family protein, partial [bacterium]
MSEPVPFLALGDSYTIGEGVTPAERWPVRLARALTAGGMPVAEPRIVARTGWTVAEMLGAMEREGVWPDGGRHALVSLLIGVNDQYRGLAPADTLADHDRALARAVALAGDQPARVVAVSIPDWGATPYAAGRASHARSTRSTPRSTSECARSARTGWTSRRTRAATAATPPTWPRTCSIPAAAPTPSGPTPCCRPRAGHSPGAQAGFDPARTPPPATPAPCAPTTAATPSRAGAARAGAADSASTRARARSGLGIGGLRGWV